MIRKRLYLSLYFIAFVKTTLLQTAMFKIRYEIANRNNGDLFEKINDINIVTSFVYIEFMILSMIILYFIVKPNPNPSLINIRSKEFLKENLLLSLFYLIGFLTVYLIMLLFYNFSDEDAAIDLYNSILRLNGFMNLGNTTYLLNFNDQFKYTSSYFLSGLSNLILPLLTINYFNLLHYDFQDIKKNPLYPEP